MKKPLVAVVAFNEELNILATLEDLEPYRHIYDFVVIDNCSSDDTPLLCTKKGVPLIRHCVNTGSSAGTLHTYFRYAHENRYSILAQFDGDGQHVASELEKIIAVVQDDRADCAIGSRFLRHEGFQSFFLRRAGITLFAFIDSLLIGTRLTDITSGFRAYGPRAIELLGYRMRTQMYDPNQLLLAMHYAGLRLAEVPVVMRPRARGRSEFNALTALAFPLKAIVNVVGSVLQKRQFQRLGRPWDPKLH